MKQGPFNVMLSAAGRRVELLHLIEQSLEQLALTGNVIASDISLAAPAMQVARERAIAPSVRAPECLEAMLSLARDRHIALVIPTIDPELGFYAQHREAFARGGIAIAVSSPEVIAICGDKVATHQFLVREGFPTVQQWTLAAALRSDALPFPVVVKPRFGSASLGVSAARSPIDLQARSGEQNELIVQSSASGREYTVDVFVDAGGRCRCAVPRLRIETRAGEVSKGVTVRQPRLIELAMRIAEVLPGARGVLNFQIFLDEVSGACSIIELNGRFGGGYPLAHASGAPMLRWLIEECAGLSCNARQDSWREGLVMLRYDQSVFVDAAEARIALPVANSAASS